MRNSRYLLYILILAVLFTLPFYTGVYLLKRDGYHPDLHGPGLELGHAPPLGTDLFRMAGLFGVGGYAAVLLYLTPG